MYSDIVWDRISFRFENLAYHLDRRPLALIDDSRIGSANISTIFEQRQFYVEDSVSLRGFFASEISGRTLLGILQDPRRVL